MLNYQSSTVATVAMALNLDWMTQTVANPYTSRWDDSLVFW
jgi:hypothetical protein